MPAFDPLSGMAVAHDVLEHWPNDDSTTGELLALGAILHVRGSDYYANKGSYNTAPSYHFSGKLGDLLLKIQWGEWVSLRDFPRHHAATTDEWARKEIAQAIKLAKKYIRQEYNRQYEPPSEATWKTAQYWLTEGYNKARRRYRNVESLLETFIEIEEKADKALKFAESGITELVVKLSWERGIISDIRSPNLQVYTVENYEGE